MKDIKDEVDQVDVEGSRVDVTGRYRSVLGFPNFVLFHRVVRSYVLSLTVVGVTGCSTQPSTYEYHYKTDDEEMTISSTGSSSVYTGMVNTSHRGSVHLKQTPTPGHLILTGDKYLVYKNGERDHRSELRLLQMESQYKKPSYGTYTVDQTKREFDYRLKRKIDREIDRLMDKIF